MSCDVNLLCQYLDQLTNARPDSIKESSNFKQQLEERITSIEQLVRKNKILRNKIKEYDPYLLKKGKENHSLAKTVWLFVEWCLVILLILKETLEVKKDQQTPQWNEKTKAPVLQNDVLGALQQKIISSAFQFIVALGINPSLLSGVGIPIQDRTQFVTIIQEVKYGLPSYQKYYQLIACVTVLLDCTNNSSIGDILLHSYLTDLICALFQLCYAPIKKLQAKDQLDTSTPENLLGYNKNQFTTSEFIKRCTASAHIPSAKELVIEMEKERPFLLQEFGTFIKKLHKPTLINSLFQLQVISSSQWKNDNKSAPKWLKNICGTYLTQELLRPQGVIFIIQGLLEPAFVNQNDPTDWKRCEAVGKVIAHVPHSCFSAESYYKKICPQILSILSTKELIYDKKYYLTAIYSISSITELHPSFATEYIYKPLLKPLLICLQFSELDFESVSEEILATEEELNKCIENLYEIVICHTGLPQNIWPHLYAVFFPLFHLYCFTVHGIFYLKQQVEEVILIMLKTFEEPVSLINSVLFDQQLPEGIQSMNDNVSFVYGDLGSIKIKKEQSIKSEEYLERKYDCILELIRKLNDKNIMGQIFFILLQKLQDMQEDLEKEDTKSNKSENSFTFLDDDDLYSNKLHQNILILKFIQEISQSFGDDIVENNCQAILFIQKTLDRCTQSYINDSSLQTETLALALGALIMLLNPKDKIKSEDFNELKKCIPSLQKLAEICHQSDIKTTAQELLTIIATHGAAGSLKDIDIKNSNKNEMPLNKFSKNTDSKMVSDQQNIKEKPKFDNAWKELNSVMVPEKGHALITFKKLIESKDPETINNFDKLLKIFKECLSHEDSYVYLSSIQCLTALGIVDSDKVIPELANEFHKISENKDIKMKLGEALMHISKQLGDLAPKYRDILLPVFLNGTKDADSEIRASCLSNLGEICQRLKYTLGPYLQEIIVCLQSLIQTDPSIEVKRAAVMLISLLLRGLNKCIFKVLENELLGIYRLLKKVFITETDEVIRLHVEIALEELNIIICENFVPSSKLTKEIRILDSV